MGQKSGVAGTFRKIPILIAWAIYGHILGGRRRPVLESLTAPRIFRRITVQPTSGGTNLQGVVGVLGLFAGLCAVFALIVTGTDAWREHAQKSWPAATAVLQRCNVEPYHPFRRDGGGVVWSIECRLTYAANTTGEQVVSRIHSRSARGDVEVATMHGWVAQHRPGSSIPVHYDPVDPTRAVLTETDMPYAGPRTPNNLKILLVALGTCAVLLTISFVLRGQPRENMPPQDERSFL